MWQDVEDIVDGATEQLPEIEGRRESINQSGNKAYVP